MVANVNKAFTSLEQSKQLMKLGIGISAADMHYWETDVETFGKQSKQLNTPDIGFDSNFYYGTDNGKIYHYIPAWSLAALLSILHNKAKVIPSLSGGGYKAGKYTSDWCLDYEFENGDYQRTFADSPVDACYNMIVRLQDLNLL